MFPFPRHVYGHPYRGVIEDPQCLAIRQGRHSPSCLFSDVWTSLNSSLFWKTAFRHICRGLLPSWSHIYLWVYFLQLIGRLFCRISCKIRFFRWFCTAIFFASNKLAFSSCFVSGCVSSDHGVSKIINVIILSTKIYFVHGTCTESFIWVPAIIYFTNVGDSSHKFVNTGYLYLPVIPGICIYTCRSMYMYITFFL